MTAGHDSMNAAPMFDQILRDLYKHDKDHFFAIFGIEQQVTDLIRNLTAQGLKGPEHYRALNDGIESIYIASIVDAKEKQKCIDNINAGGGPFYPGYREDVMYQCTEAYFTQDQLDIIYDVQYRMSPDLIAEIQSIQG